MGLSGPNEVKALQLGTIGSSAQLSVIRYADAHTNMPDSSISKCHE